MAPIHRMTRIAQPSGQRRRDRVAREHVVDEVSSRRRAA
jgi:hypothetical protein